MQRSTHFFKQLQALSQTNGRLFITKIGPCTYTRIHCLCFAGKMSTNLRKKRQSPLKFLKDWPRSSGKRWCYNHLQYLPERGNTSDKILFLRPEGNRESCCRVLQTHERNAPMSLSISTIERKDNMNSSFDIIKTKSKELIISSASVDDLLQLETARRHICTSISGLKHKAR